MSVVTVVSAKGSPGVTTLALSLAQAWEGRAIAADLDPVGGDIALLARTPEGRALDDSIGLVSLGAALRRGTDLDLEEHLVPTSMGVDVLLGAAGPAQAQSLGPAWPHLHTPLQRFEGTVIADGGRFTAGSPVASVLSNSAAAVFVARADVPGIAHLRERLVRMQRSAGIDEGPRAPTGVVLVGDARDRHGEEDVARLLDSEGVRATVLGTVSDEPKSVAMIAQGLSRRLARTEYFRSVRSVAGRLLELTGDRPQQLQEA